MGPTVFWSVGIESPKRIERDKLLDFLKEKWAANPKLVTVMKFDRAGKYSTMVDLIDELNVSGINRFSLAPMEDNDKALIAKAQ